MECMECYSEDNTKKPRMRDIECLKNHEQYICGTCGRYICIDEHPNRKLRRWNDDNIFSHLTLIYKKTSYENRNTI